MDLDLVALTAGACAGPSSHVRECNTGHTTIQHKVSTTNRWYLFSVVVGWRSEEGEEEEEAEEEEEEDGGRGGGDGGGGGDEG